MHPLRKLREAGPPTPEQAAAILAENVVMHSPVLVKPIVGRELVAITISNSSHSRDDPGKYVFEADGGHLGAEAERARRDPRFDGLPAPLPGRDRAQEQDQ